MELTDAIVLATIFTYCGFGLSIVFLVAAGIEGVREHLARRSREKIQGIYYNPFE